MNNYCQGKQAREKWMRHELMCICYLKLEGLYIRLNWEFKLTTKISCMTQINMSSRWTARIKVEDREACFKRLRKRWLGGSKETDTGQKKLEILESWRALCWRVSLFGKWMWLVNQRWISFLYEGRFKVTNSSRHAHWTWRCCQPQDIVWRRSAWLRHESSSVVCMSFYVNLSIGCRTIKGDATSVGWYYQKCS